ncbi:MAG: MraY family glycosyltransferase [Bacteroidetes bacterium]|nr:MraY family glycosyltransferase [Bacteroidota bacterium]
MNSMIYTILQAMFASMIAGGLAIALLRKYSRYIGLIDKPGKRKVHQQPVPVVGGIAIITGTIAGLLTTHHANLLLQTLPALAGGCLLLFVTGVSDDRFNIKPRYRLLLQLGCAALVAASGIRITSLFGVLGIDEMNTIGQYILTIVVITGVTNAFNLIDGIDGLAGGLAIINLSLLAVLSYWLQQYVLFVLLITTCGAVFIFLRSNVHPARIFMGDGGSLVLGFLMAVAGILLVKEEQLYVRREDARALVLVPAMLALPVFDSLRVYAGRLLRGGSPFQADKTHLHHLFLGLGFTHRKATMTICGIQVLLILIAMLVFRMMDFQWTMVLMASAYLLICSFLKGYISLQKWTQTIRKMEGVN